MSGENAFDILKKIFKAKNEEPFNKISGYTIKYGHIVDNMEVVDEVLVSFFKSPKSYTMENMCEINSHGGNIIVHKILELCLKNGAVLAEPGEFTKRAFFNGRIDLAQAESVIDVINAKSKREAVEGIKQLEGALSKRIKDIKSDILEIMTNIEVSIDYPEYDTPAVLEDDLKEKIGNSKQKLIDLEKSFENGKIIKNGIKTAIIGRPNTGKSSLLNAVLMEERAIVTEYEGTTRDTIEEMVSIKGIPIQLIDTAGIRSTSDEVEKIGVEKSKRIAKVADLVICLIDSSLNITPLDEEILNSISPENAIIILNKSDLVSKIDKEDIRLKKFKHIIKISALKNEGLEDLYNEIEKMFHFSEINFDNDILITNERHKDLIRLAIEHLDNAENSLNAGMPIDIIAISLKNVLEDLGKITGEEATEEIIDEIFSKFCLGK